MKIYFAAGAPGSDCKETTLALDKRLLSYFHIIDHQVAAHFVFNAIKKGSYGNYICSTGNTQFNTIKK